MRTCYQCGDRNSSVTSRFLRQGKATGRVNLCDNCYNSMKNSSPISLSNEEWAKKLKDWSPTNTISDIPTDAIIPFITFICECSNCLFAKQRKLARARPCMMRRSDMNKKYIVYISRCVRVSKEWKDYFNDPTFWKPAFVNFKVDSFYERKLNILMSEKFKKIKTSNWSNEDIRANKCRMIVINETKDIPFNIYWISKNGTKIEPGRNKKMYTLEGSDEYCCSITYTNSRWICIPTKEWLRENPYSTIGFSWIVNVLELKEYIMPDGKDKLAYIIRIRTPDFNKMNPIKDINKDFKDYRKKIIPLVFNKTEYEHKWTSERNNRNADIISLNQARKTAKKMKRKIHESEKKKKDQMYILNMFDS